MNFVTNESSVGKLFSIGYTLNIISAYVSYSESPILLKHVFFPPQVFHEMVSAGVEPNVHTYGALIDGCGRAGEVAKAFGAYGIMRSKVLLH
jgi:pentatricopeptide repeat protein